MSHEFVIRALDNDNNEFCSTYVSGRLDGLLYMAFDMEEHNAGFSGDGIPEIIGREKCLQDLNFAIKAFPLINYPDKNKLNNLKDFLLKCEMEYPHCNKFEVCFY